MMVRVFFGVVLACLWAGLASAQGFSARARVIAEETMAQDTGAGLRLELGLSQGVPYRVFTLTEPARLVADFREVDWADLPADRLEDAKGISQIRRGRYRPGWSRMIVDLAGPLALDSADLRIDSETGRARLVLSLEKVSAEAFSARSVQPADPDWGLPVAAQVTEARRRQTGEGPITVVIDPGHGGVDPGAQRAGVEEKDLMLTLGLELRDALLRTGEVQVVMTREVDEFVPLETRVTIAHQAQADLFLSLHADALEGGGARGATVYTLSDDASDKASEKLAERHNRADLLAGVDLSGQDDVVAHVLMDLARTETAPRSARLADILVGTLQAAERPMHARPLRQAGFSVLKAPDVPSILLEVGFLSSQRDRNNIRNPEWRAVTVSAITQAILEWAIADASEGQLIRQ